MADAYDGRLIRDCTADFLEACAGGSADTLQVEGRVIGIRGNSRMLSYVGHDGLMDFSIDRKFTPSGNSRDAIILACYSKRYFEPLLRQTAARPYLWSTGLMSPEAYTLHAALELYLKGRPAAEGRMAAATAYAQYQHCSVTAARRLLVSGY